MVRGLRGQHGDSWCQRSWCWGSSLVARSARIVADASASQVILHDSDFNPQVDRQAEDRCHRIGQTRPVTVYKLVAAGTVDEQIVALAESKAPHPARRAPPMHVLIRHLFLCALFTHSLTLTLTLALTLNLTHSHSLAQSPSLPPS